MLALNPDPIALTELDSSLAGTDPAFNLVFPSSTTIGGVVFHPDGDRAFVLLHPNSINLWRVTAFIWPETITVIFAVILVIWRRKFLRSSLRDDSTGKFFCAKCGYPAAGRDIGPEGSVNCPECGVDRSLTPPIPKSRRLPRLILTAICLFGILGVYLGARVVQAGRDTNWTPARFKICSTWLFSMIERLGANCPSGFTDLTDRVVEVDLRQGSITRVVYSASTHTASGLVQTPDGESVFLIDREYLMRVDTRSGKVISELFGPRRPKGWTHGWTEVSGVSSDGATAFAAFADEGTSRCWLMAWNFVTHETPVLVDEQSRTINFIDGGRAVFPRRYVLLDDSTHPVVVSIGQRADVSPLRGYNADGTLRPLDTGGLLPEIGNEVPVRIPGRSELLMVARSGSGGSELCRIDGATGAAITRFSLNGMTVPHGLPCFGASKTCLLLPAGENIDDVLVWDLQENCGKSYLHLPHGAFIRGLFACPQGQWVACEMRYFSPVHKSELLFFKMTPADPPASTKPRSP